MYDPNSSPRLDTTGREGEDEEGTGAPLSGVRHRLFLAEDDAEMRALIAAVLRTAGWEVLEAEDGAELSRALALEGVAQTMRDTRGGPNLDLVISDIHMPGSTGMEVLARMRRARLETPVILMTACGDERTRAEASRLGAEMVLDKPFPMAALLAAVGAVANRAA